MQERYRGRIFLLPNKKQMLQGTKESQRINYFTHTVYWKWALQPISSAYDDIYQEKFNTIFQTYLFSQMIRLLKHSLHTHEMVLMETTWFIEYFSKA